MKKKLVSILLASVLCVSLVACGGSSSTTETTEETAEEAAEEETTVEETAEETASVDYPTKGITIICPYGAGGGTDLGTRMIAQVGETALGVTMTVDNKTGGSGTVGLSECLAAEADGYTLVSGTPDLITLPLLGLAPEGMDSDSFELICAINAEPAAIIVSADSEWDTIEDFVQDAIDNPGSIQIATAGSGNIWHLAMIGLELESGASFTYVPYADGASAEVVAVLNGDVQAMACSPAEAASNIEAGKMKVLGIAADERLEAYPDVPTFKECGWDLTIMAVRGLAASSDVPADVLDVLREAFGEAVYTEEAQELVEQANMTYMPMTAEEAEELFASMSGSFEAIIEQYLASAE